MATLNDLFVVSAAEAADRIKAALSDDTFCERAGGPGPLPMLAWRMLPGAVAGRLATLLDVPLSDILVGGWNKSYALRQHLQRSAKSPGKEFFLQLAEHKISSSHQPYVALLKNGQEVARLRFTVAVELLLQGAVLRILDGRIREIQTGQVKGKGVVKCGGAILVEKELQALTLPATLSVGTKPDSARSTAGGGTD